MKIFKSLVVAELLYAGTVYAETPDERFHVNAVYLLNIVPDAHGDGTSIVDSGGMASFIGYDILPWLSFEAGAIVFDTVNMRQNTGSFVQETHYDVSGFTLGLKGTTSFANLFDVWGSIGIYSWKSTFDYEVVYPNFPPIRSSGNDSMSSSNAYVRLGARIPLGNKITATIESGYFEFNNLFYDAGGKNTDFSHSCIGLGFEYKF